MDLCSLQTRWNEIAEQDIEKAMSLYQSRALGSVGGRSLSSDFNPQFDHGDDDRNSDTGGFPLGSLSERTLSRSDQGLGRWTRRGSSSRAASHFSEHQLSQYALTLQSNIASNIIVPKFLSIDPRRVGIVFSPVTANRQDCVLTEEEIHHRLITAEVHFQLDADGEIDFDSAEGVCRNCHNFAAATKAKVHSLLHTNSAARPYVSVICCEHIHLLMTVSFLSQMSILL